MTCVIKKNEKVEVLSENGRSARFINTKGTPYEVGQVDDCLIKGSIERCDKFIRNENYIWLVEIKGGDISKAVHQIISTTKNLTKEIGSRKVNPVIVSTKCPASAGQEKHLITLSKGIKNKGSVHIRTNVIEIKI